MHKIFLALVMITACLAASSARAEQAFSIAAIVNEDAVSGADVQDRMRLILASSGMKNTEEIRARIMPQVINGLIEEQIQMQEARRLEIVVTDEEIESGFAAIAAQNNMPAEKFLDLLKHQGIPQRTLARQIKAQIAWSKVVAKLLRPQIDITPNDVIARMERLRANIGKTEYLTAEIFLPVENPAEESKTRQLADELTRDIRNKKVPFQAVAVQFSKAAGAAQGGSLGWVQQGQLPKELDAVLTTLNEGEVSAPTRSLSGFHILTVRKKRTIAEENLPSEDDLTNQIGMERLERLQHQHLSDLKSTAFIDRRV